MKEVDFKELSEKTEDVIKAMCSPDRADKIAKLIDDVGAENYFSAPASSRESYHNCYPGGLAEHNLNVVSFLIHLNEISELDFDYESLCVVGLLHDLGKVINTDFERFYKTEEERWKIDRGELFSKNDGSTYFTAHQRTMWILSHFGFKLSPEEYQAILLNDGQYIQENKPYAHKTNNLGLLLHMADTLALMKERKAENVKK